MVNAGFLLNMEAVVSQHGICKKCGEELNMYGGCRCNGYTTAFNAVENRHIPQQTNGAEPAEIKPDCGNCLLATHCNYFGFPSDSCGYSPRV